jgi:hypothetical protein
MKSNLNRFSLFALICLVSVSTAMAAPTCGNTVPGPGPQNAKLSTLYVTSTGSANGYICDIDNLEFSKFSDNNLSVDPSQITVVPITTPGFEGLDFSGPWDTSSVEDVDISFTVTALSGLLTDVHIDLINASVTGTGAVKYTETVCSGSNCAVYANDTAAGTGVVSGVLYLTTPTTSISVDKDLILNAGSNGTASMSNFDNYYSHTVPEPRTVSVFLGIAFFGAMVFMKRRQAVRS